MTFYVGQKVVCVEAPEIDPAGIRCPLVNGRVYTITSLLEFPRHPVEKHRFGLTLYEVAPPRPYVGFARFMFRPAVERKTDISIFREMLTNDSVSATAGADS